MNEGEDQQAAKSEGQSIKGMLAQLADDAIRLVRAEIDLQRASFAFKADRAKPAVAGLIACAMLAQAAVVVGLVMLAIGLADRIGAIAAGFAVTGGTLLVAALFALLAIRRLERLSGDEP